jgi:RNase H-like domain found in reverse transcriptase
LDKEAFIKIRALIADSPTLFFMDATAPIYLMTDASDYGIGGYLYQIVNNEKQLVSLVSKALTATQLAWSTIQKEAYAIFFCCTYLDNLLRDRKFTILTDHQDVTFIKQASNPMIVRWHLVLQELDFNIEFVKGVDNIIADAMSRLCINNKPSLKNSTVYNGPYRVDPIYWKNIKLVHNAQSGHCGVIKLQKDLKLTWKNMKLDVMEFIKKCVTNKNVTNKNSYHSCGRSRGLTPLRPILVWHSQARYVMSWLVSPS